MADIAITVGGSFSGILVVGDNNFIQAERSTVEPRDGPPPKPSLRRNLPLPRVGPPPIGRDTELARIEEWLDDGLPVEVIGPPGIGKTALLRALIGRCGKAGKEAVYLTTAGLDVEDIVQELFQVCYDSEDYKPDPVRLRRLMGQVRSLIVLDDVTGTAEEIDALLDAVPSARLVISSTERRLWGEGHAVELGGLPAEPALAVVERVLDRPLDAAERELFAAFRQEVDGHPLAMIQAAWVVRTQPSLPVGREALASALAAGLGEQAHATLSLFLAVHPAAVPPELVEAIVGELQSLTVLEEAGLVVSGQAALPMARLVARAVPDPADYLPSLTSWAAGASAKHIARSAPVIVAILTATVAQGAAAPALVLARTTAPALCRTLQWGAWRRVLALGKQAAHALGAAEDEAYFDHEEESRLKALGRGALIGAIAGAAEIVGQHVGSHAVAAKGTATGIKGILLSPVTVTVAAAIAVGTVVGAVSYANSTDRSARTPTTSAPTFTSLTSPTSPAVQPTATTASAGPLPEPTTDVAGVYVLSRRLTSCEGFSTCGRDPLHVRVDCADRDCTITETSSLFGNHDLTIDGDTMKTSGPDQLFDDCHGAHRPGEITLTLTVVSWKVDSGNHRRPSELSGRLTTSSATYKDCAAGKAAWDLSTRPSTQDTSPYVRPTKTSTSPRLTGSPCQNSPSRKACDEQDPHATGCDHDATVVPGGSATGPLHGTEFSVELLWSPTCQSNWSRARPTRGSAQFSPWIEPGRGDATRFSTKTVNTSAWINSPMAYSDSDAKPAKACLGVPGSAQPYWLCTGMLTPDGQPA